MELTWLGHSTVLFQLDGARILTDPLLRKRTGPLRRTAPPITADLSELDLVLISHAHRDHLDIPSLRTLPRSVKLAVPAGAGKHVRSLGFADLVEVVAGDSISVGGVTVVATHADHQPGRDVPRRRPLPVGYLLHGSTTAYFAGDTDVFPEMSGFGPIDVALLPVSCWGPTV